MCQIHQFLSCSLSFHSSTLYELSLAIGYCHQVTIVSIAVTEVSTSGLDPDHSGLSTSVAPQPRIEVWATLVRAAESILKTNGIGIQTEQKPSRSSFVKICQNQKQGKPAKVILVVIFRRKRQSDRHVGQNFTPDGAKSSQF